MTALHWEHLGRIGYGDALALQLGRRDAVIAGTAPETLFTLEHDPVITLGRRAQPGDLLVDRDALAARGIEVVEVDRGGEVTYHGPGQLVLYAVVHCQRRGMGPSDLVRRLAAAITDELAQHGISASYDTEHPGLWVEGAKIAAVGMRISRGVSTHGAALNLTTDLDAFSLIVPCGMPGARATSMLAQTGCAPQTDVIAASIARRFADSLLEVPLRPTGPT